MLFLDTSAVVKRYVAEDGSEQVAELMEDDRDWCASALCYPETRVTICHLGFDAEALAALASAADADWERFFVVPLDELCLAQAVEIGCVHRVRTLDAVHLAAAARLPGRPLFVSFDARQRDAASALGLPVV